MTVLILRRLASLQLKLQDLRAPAVRSSRSLSHKHKAKQPALAANERGRRCESCRAIRLQPQQRLSIGPMWDQLPRQLWQRLRLQPRVVRARSPRRCANVLASSEHIDSTRLGGSSGNNKSTHGAHGSISPDMQQSNATFAIQSRGHATTVYRQKGEAAHAAGEGTRSKQFRCYYQFTYVPLQSQSTRRSDVSLA